MKIVIDIPGYAYERIKEYYDALPEGGEVDANVVYIAEGTPLPKGHGRLIDADELKANIHMYHRNRYCTQKDVDTSFYVINNAPTIIEADKDGD